MKDRYIVIVRGTIALLPLPFHSQGSIPLESISIALCMCMRPAVAMILADHVGINAVDDVVQAEFGRKVSNGVRVLMSVLSTFFPRL